MSEQQRFSLGDKVHRSREGSDYQFWGWIVGEITKRSGAVRYAVEDDRGRIFVIHPKDLTPGWLENVS